MRRGLNLPNVGAGVGPEDVARAARRAEELGYANLWVIERLLYPIEPRSPYPVTPDGSLPSYYKHALTPFETLAFAAAHTRTIGLGTSVVLMPIHNPVLLARQVATLDVLSGGRMRLGLGQGWSLDEIVAGGGQMAGRGERADEYVEVLKAIWTTDPARFEGKHYTLPASILQPKPVQSPRPPIYMAAYVASALERIGRSADGWMPSGVPLAALGPMMERVRAAAREAGRDPNALELLVWAFLDVRDRPLGEGRPDWVGSWEEIRADVERARELGVTEIIFEPGYATDEFSLDTYVELMERIPELTEARAPEPVR